MRTTEPSLWKRLDDLTKQKMLHKRGQVNAVPVRIPNMNPPKISMGCTTSPTPKHRSIDDEWEGS